MTNSIDMFLAKEILGAYSNERCLKLWEEIASCSEQMSDRVITASDQLIKDELTTCRI